jgi:TRAP-type C4-dicarboxylate transport system permease small subunit
LNPFQQEEQALPGKSIIGAWAGVIAGLALVVLSASILYGVALRMFGIEDIWSFDLDIFVMIWFGMVGAAYTAHLDSHVTAGIALERRWTRAAGTLRIVRFILTAIYLLALVFFGVILTWQSFESHTTTWDLALWPEWIAQAAVPVGAFAWLAVILSRLIDTLRSR